MLIGRQFETRHSFFENCSSWLVNCNFPLTLARNFSNTTKVSPANKDVKIISNSFLIPADSSPIVSILTDINQIYLRETYCI